MTEGSTTLDLGSLPNADKGVRVVITNSGGAIVYIGKSDPDESDKFSINTSTWAAGTYFVVVKLNGATYTGKFVVIS